MTVPAPVSGSGSVGAVQQALDRRLLSVSGEPGQAEVEEPRSRLRQHDVAGLQVAVDDALLVGGGQGVRDLGGAPPGLLERQRPLLQPFGQRLARRGAP